MKQRKNFKTTIQQQQRSTAFQFQQALELANHELQSGDKATAVQLYKNVLHHLPIHFPGYAMVTHNLLVAYKQCITELLANQDFPTVNTLVHEAIELELRGQFSDNEQVRRDFADMFHSLGNVFFDAYQFPAALHCFRKAISVQFCPTYHVNLTNTLAILKSPAKLSDFGTSLKESKLGTHIFITCLPKSGSTFLKNVLCQVTGFKDLFMVYNPWQFEQEIYLPVLQQFAEANTVTQQHNRASESCIQTMQAYGIRPVVLIRNVFDAVASLLDFYRNGAAFNSYFRGEFEKLDHEDQLDVIIENLVPWYFQFFASWVQVERDRRFPLMWLTYEELVANKPQTVRRVLNFHNLDMDPEIIGRTIAHTETETRKNRFNRGIVGRGESLLSDRQKETIRRMARFYPSIDFSRLGISKE